MYRTERPKRQTIALNLLLDGRPVLVVGGGQVGRRKVASLLDAGAPVTLVCPDAVEELAARAAAGEIRWLRRAWCPGDAAGHLLVFACTDDKHVNRAILEDARALSVMCCCSDMNWPDGDFTTPATLRVGDLSVAVSTSGQSCATARDVKNEIAGLLRDRCEPELLVLGTSDALLPSRKRAPFHLPADERAALGRLIARVNGVREFFILNTCNRVELVVMATPDPDVLAVLRKLTGFDRLTEDEQFLYRGYAAFRHLVNVTSGLESALLGENHIVSQMKDALAEAERNRWAGAGIRQTGAEILRVTKEVRHAVEGLLHVAEVDQVAVRYLSVHGGLDGSTHVLVIGTGMVGTAAVRALVKMGVTVTWAYHRNRPDFVRTVQLDDLASALKEADIVLSAVDAARPVVTAEMRAAVAERNVLFVDLGVPRNIDPFYDDWGHGVTVADLDDLKLWHRVKTGTLNTVRARAEEVIAAEYRMAKTGWTNG